MTRVTAARILMVEDSDAIRLPVVTALTAHGFAVASAADGADLEHRLRGVRARPGDPGRDAARAGRLRAARGGPPGQHGGGADADRPGHPGRPAARADRRARTTIWSSRSPWPSWWPGCTRCCAAPGPAGLTIAVGDLVINDDATSVPPRRRAAGADRHRAAAARLPRRPPRAGGQQDPDPDRDLGLRRVRRQRGRGARLVAAPQARGRRAVPAGAHRTRARVPARRRAVSRFPQGGDPPGPPAQDSGS